MSQTKAQDIRDQINALIDGVVKRDGLTLGPASHDALYWIRFYVKDLTTECVGCSESHNEAGGGESKNETPQSDTEK